MLEGQRSFNAGGVFPLKFQRFTDDELREIASLIAGRNLVTARRDDILGDIYNQIIIELRDRRTLHKLVDNFQLKLEE
tara:strand:- start:10 stop:243 length:234 start_codon:yes stop_codon:yes gene_type:complete